MEQPVYRKLAALAETTEAVEKSVSYLRTHMSGFLKKNDRVLILSPKKDSASSRILEESILGCECTPIWMGEDCRWMTLLKTAFTTKSNCLVGSPLTLLGLSKLAKHMGTPLFVRNVLMVGYPTTSWIVEGVRRGLDCMAWGCFDPGDGAVIGGFTCKQLDGVHVRTEEYSVEIVGDDDVPLPQGEAGRVVLYPNEDPSLRFAVGDRGRLDTDACSCGSSEPKLVDMDVIKEGNEDLSDLGESLHYWSSILDCRIEKTPYGVELEMVVFPGEKLPQLPTVAKQIIRSFNPELDEPFEHQEVLKKRYLSEDAH